MGEAFVIGIAGGSASGKTTLARKLVANADPGEALIVGLDSFYWDVQQFPAAIREPTINFDHPEALDFIGLCQAIDVLRDGQSVEIPVYDFAQHKRTAFQRVDPAPILIVEGILALAVPSVRQRLDIGVFVDVAADVRLGRRKKRDISERGRTSEGVTDQWEATVAPMHDQFVQPSREFADIVSAGSDFDVLVRRLLRESRKAS